MRMYQFLIMVCLIVSSVWAADHAEVVAEQEKPVVAERQGVGNWFIDFGKAAFGTVEIAVPKDGSELEAVIHLGEKLAKRGVIDRKPGGTVRYQSHKLELKPGEVASPKLTWAPPGWLKSGFLLVPDGMPEVMPFRYVELENMPSWFTAAHIRRVSYAVPFDEEASSFESSNANLDSVWELCKHSMKATSFLGVYVDGDRERRPYEADVLINQLSHYCVDSHYDTARYSQDFLIKHPTWPTEWRLQTPLISWNDYLWSGDDAGLRKHYDVLRERSMIDRRNADGLFRGWVKGDITDIVDWPVEERDGYDMEMPIKTVVTAFHYRALVVMEKIAGHLGKDEDAKEYAQLAEATYNAVNEQLWNEEKGCYMDGLNPDQNALSKHASAHANFFPLALGLVPEERVAKVAAFLKPRGMACSVYGAQFLLEALYEAGEAEHALKLMAAEDKRSWIHMVRDLGSTVTLEAWDPEIKPNLDWNHAWGAAPANIIPRGLMGIEPLEPGFARFRVKPQTASLQKAKVKLPTPKGAVVLSVVGQNPRSQSIGLIVPADSVAEFHCPGPGEWVAEEQDGGSSELLREEKGRKVLQLSSGTWTIRARK